MDRTTWEQSTDPKAMLDYVTGRSEGPHAGGIISDRKLRLFVCACLRMALDRDPTYPDAETAREAILAGELVAEGQLALAEARKTFKGWLAVSNTAADQVCNAHWLEGRYRLEVAGFLREIVNPWVSPEHWPHGPCPECRGSGIIACGSHKMGHPCPACNGSGSSLLAGPWNTWNGGVVLTLAQTIYARRAWEELPILADALQEAGCPAEEPYENWSRDWLCTECESRVELKNTFVQGNLVQAYSCPRHGWRDEKTGVKGKRTYYRPHPLLAHLRGGKRCCPDRVCGGRLRFLRHLQGNRLG